MASDELTALEPRKSLPAKRPESSVTRTHRLKPQSAKGRTSRQKGLPKSSKQAQTVMAQLFKLLQGLPADRRRSVLRSRLTEENRRELEQWILAHRMAGQPPQKEVLKAAAAVQYPQHASADVRPTRRKGSCDSLPVAKRSRCKGADTCESRALKWSSVQNVVSCEANTSHVPGIVSHFRGAARLCYYSAGIAIGALRVRSKTTKRLELALCYRAILLTIKRRTIDGTTDNFEERFKEAAIETFNECGVNPQDMGFRLVVSVRTRWIAVPLRTRPFSFMEVDAGLRAWRRLVEASTGGSRFATHQHEPCTPWTLQVKWLCLRETYLRVMVESGCCPEKVSKRLDAMQAIKQEQLDRMASRWQRSQRQLQERQQRRLFREGCRSRALEQRRAAIARRDAARAASIERKIDALLLRWTMSVESKQKRC